MGLKEILVIIQVLGCGATLRYTMDPYSTTSLEHMGINVKKTTSVTFRIEVCGTAMFELHTKTSSYEVRMNGEDSVLSACNPTCYTMSLVTCSAPGVVTVSWANKRLSVAVGCAPSTSDGVTLTSPPTSAKFTSNTGERVELEFGDDVCHPPTTTTTTTTTTLASTSAAKTTTSESAQTSRLTSSGTPESASVSTTTLVDIPGTPRMIPDLGSGSPGVPGFSVFCVLGAGLLLAVAVYVI